jgi:pimeloyl-ACP methyl ester carboxylesterase
VLLRGLAREAAHWGTFGRDLVTGLPGSEFVFADLPGAGDQRHLRAPTQVESMVDACRADLAGRGLMPPYHLLGLSLGGMVASAWCAQHPEELVACVLVNTSLRPYSGPLQRLRPSALPTLLRLLLPMEPRRAEALVLRVTSARPQHHADVLDIWATIRRERPVSTLDALRQLIAAGRYRHDTKALRVPTLVVCSAADALVDPACSRQLAARCQLPLVVHPDAGHDLPLDDGPWLADQIARQLACWRGRSTAH